MREHDGSSRVSRGLIKGAMAVTRIGRIASDACIRFRRPQTSCAKTLLTPIYHRIYHGLVYLSMTLHGSLRGRASGLPNVAVGGAIAVGGFATSSTRNGGFATCEGSTSWRTFQLLILFL